jgi:GT2 family glycosyltransferase
MKVEASDTTIGMVTYNRLDLTKETFARALQATGKMFNLVICDNNSSDDTVKWIQDEGVHMLPNLAGFVLKKLPENKGIAYGRNKCLNLTKRYFSSTEYICTLDNDVAIPNGNWLQDCCDVVDAGDKYGCCAVNFEKKNFPTTIIKTKNNNIKVKIIINTPGTACTVFKKYIFDSIGYFKRYNNDIYGHEDANFFLRVKLSGKMLFYLDESGIHLGEGEYDVGEYREMKTKVFNKNRHLFVEDMHAYSRGTKGLYLGFEEEE